MAELAVYHSLIDPFALSEYLAEHYGFMVSSRCRLIRMGLNDTYECVTAKRRYIVRVYRAAWRTLPAISAELDSLLYLKAQGMEVAAPLANNQGAFYCAFKAPEGSRALVVFDYIEGAALALDCHSAYAYGLSLANLHRATDAYSFPCERFCLDAEHLIEAPLVAIETAFSHHALEIQHLQRLAAMARIGLQALPKITPLYGYCHGDHFGNVLASPANTFIYIDFDCCGMGFRAYDVVQFYWALCLRMGAWRESFLASNALLWQAFLQGYESLRPLMLIERQALPALFIARSLWGLGMQPQNEQHWGIEQHESIWQQNYRLFSEDYVKFINA